MALSEAISGGGGSLPQQIGSSRRQWTKWFVSRTTAQRLLMVFLIVAAAAVFSLTISRTEGSVAVFWLPNSVAIGLLLMEGPRSDGVTAAAAAVAIAVANLVHGDLVIVALSFAVINAVQILLATRLFRLVLGQRWPHDDERDYLRFICLVVAPAAITTGLMGAGVLHLVHDLPFTAVAWTWVIGDAISMSTLVPLVLLLVSRRSSHQPLDRRAAAWVIVGLVAMSVIVALKIALDAVLILFLACPVVAILALQMGRAGTIVSTSYFLVLLISAGFWDRMFFVVHSDLANQATLFMGLFICVTLPANLIAAMVGRLVASEAHQRELSNMKSEFLSTMSHEIRTPMNTIHGMFELFSRVPLSDKQRSWSKAGIAASHTLQRQVDGIFDMARLDNRQILLTPRPTDLREMVESWRLAAMSDIKAMDKTLEVRCDVDHSLPEVAVLDPERLCQVVFNLTRNAVKFSDAGTITVGLRREDQQMVLTVEDQGQGIARDHHSDIFRRFWQVSSGPTRMQDGVGLGLSIASEIVALMGGTISVESELGRGSAFTITLPLIEENE